jgi:cell division protein FtsQ
MDGGGRLDQPLMRSGPAGLGEAGASIDELASPRIDAPRRRRRRFMPAWPAAGRFASLVMRLPPSGLGIAASMVLVAGALTFGVVKGQHISDLVTWFADARDGLANSLGFRIAAISLSGAKQVSREEILTTAGVTGHASLLFLDADVARARLMANPWIADAAVLKLYPDRLQITITERQAFALWQKDGRISVIADDGTVLEQYVERRYVTLPIVVGTSAEREAKEFLATLAQYPDVRSLVRASILVAKRRWNLRLLNGIDVRLPETNVPAALAQLVQLDHDKKLLTRDITMVDLRLADRVTVRLSDAAAQARDEALAGNKKKKKGGSA